MNVPATIATPPPASSHHLAALAVVTGTIRATKDKLYYKQEFGGMIQKFLAPTKTSPPITPLLYSSKLYKYRLIL
jgi:hypothetical protein